MDIFSKYLYDTSLEFPILSSFIIYLKYTAHKKKQKKKLQKPTLYQDNQK